MALATTRPDCAGGLPRDLARTNSQATQFVELLSLPSNCLPACERRRSVILYDIMGKGGRAGLLDRANAFAALGNLAASLCAHVVVGRPCDMLAAKHNIVDGNETLLNCSATSHWSRRYINLTFLDGEPVLRGPQWHEHWRHNARELKVHINHVGHAIHSPRSGTVDTRNARLA